MGWTIGKNDFVTKKGAKIQVFTRFPFSSSLKRMSTISMVDVVGSPFGGALGNRFFMIASKGAPGEWGGEGLEERIKGGKKC